MTTLRVLTADGTLHGVGLPPVSGGAAVADWSDSKLPYTLRPGESYTDNMPAGVPVVTASSVTSSTDFWTVMKAVEASRTTPCYVGLDADTYTISTLRLATTNDWRGYWNDKIGGTRIVMGLVSLRPGMVRVVEGPNMIPSDARAFMLTPPAGTAGGLPNLYFSNDGSTTPLFFSGISFEGRFQGPYGVLGASGVTVNPSAASPIPHDGMALWRAIAGSRVQFCRFRGFAFAAKASPPYETSGLAINYSTGLVVARTEIDGRLSTGEVSAGGMMPNYCQDLTVQDVWIHHTRRSGFAVHDHNQPAHDNGDYRAIRVRTEAIATTSDGFAGSPLGFSSTNVEEVNGTFTFTGNAFAANPSGQVVLGTSGGAGALMARQITLDDCVSLGSDYGGCVIIRIIRTPNSQGDSPYWTAYSTGGLAALPFTVTKSGRPLTPIESTKFNGAQHGPSTHYVVITQ